MTKSIYPPWNDPPTTPAYQDNVPVFPPPPPEMAGTKPGTAKIPVTVWTICEKVDVNQYLIPSLIGAGFQVGQEWNNESPYYPVTWGEETRRYWWLPIPNLPPPPGQSWEMNVCAKMLLSMMMARGVGYPGFWTYSVNAQMSAGLVWNFLP